MNLESSKIKAPFTVPEGYFDDLEKKLLSEARIAGLSKLNALPVPENYFEDLEVQVSALTRIPTSALQVSENYFDTLENQLLVRIKLEGLGQPAVETDYFKGLEEEILLKTRRDSFVEPVVPSGYFDTLENTILEKTSGTTKPRFTLFRNIKVVRRAAAAILVGLAGYLTINTDRPKDELAEVSSAAMIAYLADQPLMEEDLNFILNDEDVFLTSEVSDNEITAYLLENGINI